MSFHPLPFTLTTLAGLAPYQTRLNLVERCNNELARHLPVAWRNQVRVCWVEPETVWVETDNGTLAAKIRQMAPRLLAQLPTDQQPWTTLKIRIQPQARPPKITGQDLSVQTLEAFANLAAQLPEGALRQAIDSLLHERRQTHAQK